MDKKNIERNLDAYFTVWHTRTPDKAGFVSIVTSIQTNDCLVKLLVKQDKWVVAEKGNKLAYKIMRIEMNRNKYNLLSSIVVLLAVFIHKHGVPFVFDNWLVRVYVFSSNETLCHKGMK